MLPSIDTEIERYLRRYRHFMAGSDVLLNEEDRYAIACKLVDDLKAKMEQDPVSTCERFVFMSNAFRAILAYRISSHLYIQKPPGKKEAYELVAYKMAEESASSTCIEIHPGARIGSSFVIDHGINTLIGATSEIGDCCTILQNVVLGARKITYNEQGKRHPSIGDHVQISGGVRILGPVKIGHRVFIGPDCLILEDIPDNAKVKLIKSVMVIREKK